MNKTAITIVTDNGFIVPSFVVAKQLVSQGITAKADILIYLIDVEEETRLKLQGCFGYGVYFKKLTSKSFLPPADAFIHKSHIPIAALARMSIAEILPEQYDNIIYLDGDVQIVGDIMPLINYEVPEGKIAAVRGAYWLDNLNDPWIKNHMKTLKDIDPLKYFNSGVMAFKRETWKEIAPQALEYFMENSKDCIYMDQCALNVVCKGRLIEINPAYNFTSRYSELYAQYGYAPRIIHFTGPNKPWKYHGLPWYGKYKSPYVRALNSYPFLQEYLAISPDLRSSAYIVRLLKDFLKALRRPISLFTKRERLLAYMNSSFPF